jgi:hypothetical protein
MPTRLWNTPESLFVPFRHSPDEGESGEAITCLSRRIGDQSA